MVAPLLQGMDHCVPPPEVLTLVPVTHFGKRATERGVSSIPGDLLKWVVETALNSRRDDLVELVFVIDSESTLYRIHLPEGLFYPVLANSGIAVTLLTAKMLRQVKHSRARCRHRTGRRQRVRPTYG